MKCDIYLCAPNSCSSRITSAEERWTCCAGGWSRASAVTARATAEVFLPLAYRVRPSSWGCSATGAMFECFLFGRNECALVCLSLYECECECKEGVSPRTARLVFIRPDVPGSGGPLPPRRAPRNHTFQTLFFGSHVDDFLISYLLVFPECFRITLKVISLKLVSQCLCSLWIDLALDASQENKVTSTPPSRMVHR